ncbi:MAG: cytochrome P450 [Actinomycetota bacterium]
MSDLAWDPFDTDIDRDPHPVWRRLRDDAPVYRNERYDFYALSRFDDVEAAHRDPVTFSSAHGTVLEIMHADVGDFGSSIIFMDPPEHAQLRALVSRAFTPRRVAQLESRIRELCAELFDAVAGEDTFDYVQDFGARLPSEVISLLLGVPESDRAFARHHIDQMFHIEPGVGMINDTSLRAQVAIFEYMGQQLEDRRKVPRDDMLTALVQAEITDDAGSTRNLTVHEATSFANLLIAAGTETVARLLGNAAVVLGASPDQRSEVAADHALIPNAIEELLRYEAPSPVQGRWTTRAVELHGQTIPVDAKVLLLTGAAGRDERKFADPDRFDIRRRIDHHLSFGYGIHFCLGAALARLEGRIGLEETLVRFPRWEVDLDRAVRLHTSTVRGWLEVPIGVTA